MKVKTKLCATVLAVALGCGVLAGCQVPSANSGSNGGNSNSGEVDQTKYLVNVTQSSDYTVAGINAEGYVAGAKVSFTVTPASGKEIVSVGYDQIDITPKADGSYEFNMPEKNVTLIISVRAIAQYSLTYTGTLQVDGDPVTFSLKLGTDPVPTFTLEEAPGADLVDIDQTTKQVTAKAAGQTTIIAKVSGEEKARLAVTVAPTEIMTVKAALDAAIVEAPCNGSTGKNAAMSSAKTISGKVLAVSSFNNGAVQAVVDDGTAAVVLQIAKASETAADPVAVGDAIKVTTVFTNYFGLLEGISKGAKSGSTGNANNIAAADVVKIDKTFTPKLSTPEDLTAAQYDAYYTTCAANGQTSGTNRTWSEIKLANINVTFDKVDTEDNGATLYTIDGSTKSIDIKSSHDQGASFDQVKGHKSKLTGFVLGVNSKKTKSNMIATAQTPLAVQTITFKDGASKTIFLNNPVELEYTTAPEGSYGTATWTSSDPTKVSVNNGVITGLEQGSSTVSVSINGVSKSIEITVSGEQHVCESVSLNKASLELLKGANETLVATILPNNCTDAVEWVSDKPGTASVDQNGKVTAVARGTANITVTCGNYSASCAVTVREQNLQDLSTSAKGDAVDTYGYVTGMYPVSGKNGIWISDGAYGLAINMAPISGLKLGDVLHVTGTIDAFNAARQVKNDATLEVVESFADLATPVVTTIDEAFLTNISQVDQGKQVSVTGVVKALEGSGNADHTVTLTVGSKDIKVYASKNNCGQDVVESFDKAQVGRTITVSGFMSARNTTDKAVFDKNTLEHYQIINPAQLKDADVVIPTLTGIAFDKATANIEQGKSETLTIVAVPTGATLPEGTATWSVLPNDGKVTVNNGVVSVASDATVGDEYTVKAVLGGYEAACVVTVAGKSSNVTVEKTTLIGLTGVKDDGTQEVISASTPNQTQYKSLLVDSVITLSVNTDGNNGKMYGSGTEWRLYQSNNPSLVLSAAAGYKLVSVSFIYTIDKTGVLMQGDNQVASEQVVTLTGSSATFTVGNTGTVTNGQVRIKGITVVYCAA